MSTLQRVSGCGSLKAGYQTHLPNTLLFVQSPRPAGREAGVLAHQERRPGFDSSCTLGGVGFGPVSAGRIGSGSSISGRRSSNDLRTVCRFVDGDLVVMGNPSRVTPVVIGARSAIIKLAPARALSAREVPLPQGWRKTPGGQSGTRRWPQRPRDRPGACPGHRRCLERPHLPGNSSLFDNPRSR